MVVEGGQAVHEPDVRVAGEGDRLGIDLVGRRRVRCARARCRPVWPVETRTLRSRKSAPRTAVSTSSVRVIRAPLPSPSAMCEPTSSGSGHSALGAAIRTSMPEQGAHRQQRVAHVVAGVAEIAVADFLQWFGAVLVHGEDVAQALGGVCGVGQAVVDGDTGAGREFGDDRLGGAAVLDGVEHPTEDAGGVGDGLLAADVGVAGAEVGGGGALVGGGDLEGAAGAGGGLLEDQREMLAGQPGLFGAGALGRLSSAARSRRWWISAAVKSSSLR